MGARKLPKDICSLRRLFIRDKGKQRPHQGREIWRSSPTIGKFCRKIS